MSAAPAVDDFPRLEKYELLEEIGHGGMATVYRARDVRLGREVAVKIIHRHLRDNVEVATRFLAEARAAAQLEHPGIVEVYDVSDDDEREKYLVVELVRGDTLRKVFVEHPELPAEVGAALVLELCDAIEHAHEAGVIHRDIKPENILVAIPATSVAREAEEDVRGSGGARAPRSADEVRSSGGVRRPAAGDRVVIKVTDFGIAKILDAQGMTSTGQVLGSPAHMAPEQIESGDIDARTDVFALGVVLYEALVGHLPFEGKNPAQVLRRVLDGSFAPAAEERPTVGARYGEIVARALATDPKERFESARALAGELRGELAALGLEDTGAELAAYFRDPEAYVAALRGRLVPRLLERGEASRKAGGVQRAACDLNRAHALAPDDVTILKRITQLSQREARGRRLRWATLVVGLLGVGGVAAALWIHRSPVTPFTPMGALPDPPPGGASLEATADPTSLPRLAIAPSAVKNRPRVNLRALASARVPDPTAVPRAVRFVVVPKGALLEVDGAAVDHFSATPRLPPGAHVARLAPPQGDPCCEATSSGFVVQAAPKDEPDRAQEVRLSLRFRPATVRLAGAPAGGQVTCGAFLSLASGASAEVPMTSPVWEGYCTFIAGGESKNAFRTIRPGVVNALAWPVEGG